MENLETFQCSSTCNWRGELAGTAGFVSGRPKLLDAPSSCRFDRDPSALLQLSSRAPYIIQHSLLSCTLRQSYHLRSRGSARACPHPPLFTPDLVRPTFVHADKVAHGATPATVHVRWQHAHTRSCRPVIACRPRLPLTSAGKCTSLTPHSFTSASNRLMPRRPKRSYTPACSLYRHVYACATRRSHPHSAT